MILWIGLCSIRGEILSVGQILLLCSGDDMLKETLGLP
jgi:hypothetical protein